MPTGLRGSLGRLSLACFALCAGSGVALVPLYDPANARESLEWIAGGVPWGFFARGVHAWAAWGLLVCGLLHVADVLAAGGDAKLAQGVWWRSSALLGLVFAALLGGFVMRGDAGALGALRVARGLCESVPLVGAPLVAGLWGTGETQLAVVAMHHVGTFTLLVALLSAEHGARLLPDDRALVLGACVVGALAGLVPLPVGDAPEVAPSGLTEGPWYLIGLQGLLLDAPPAFGWIVPLAVLGLLGGVRHLKGPPRRAALATLAFALLAWVGFSVRFLLLAGGTR